MSFAAVSEALLGVICVNKAKQEQLCTALMKNPVRPRHQQVVHISQARIQPDLEPGSFS